MRVCAHCGQPVYRAPTSLVDLVAALDLPRREQVLAEALLRTFGRRIPSDFLVGEVYDDNRDDLLAPEQTLLGHISKLRRKLKPHGWTINNKRRSGYSITHIGGAP